MIRRALVPRLIDIQEAYNFLSYRPSDKCPAPLFVDLREKVAETTGNSTLFCALVGRVSNTYNVLAEPGAVTMPPVDQVVSFSSSGDSALWQWRGIFHVVLFEFAGHDSQSLNVVRDSLCQEAKVRSVNVIRGGFKAFELQFPFLCRCISTTRATSEPWPSMILPRVFLGTERNAKSADQLQALVGFRFFPCLPRYRR